MRDEYQEYSKKLCALVRVGSPSSSKGMGCFGYTPVVLERRERPMYIHIGKHLKSGGVVHVSPWSCMTCCVQRGVLTPCQSSMKLGRRLC